MQMPSSCVPEDRDEAYVSIPHGGPIYVSDMVGPLTRVSDFESSVLDELRDLKEEICWDSIETFHDYISVDELKILTEEELLEKAFEVAFKDGKVTGNSSQVSEEDANSGKTTNGRISDHPEPGCSEISGRGRDGETSYDFGKRSPLRTAENGELSTNISNKRKRPIRRKNGSLEGSSIAKEPGCSEISGRGRDGETSYDFAKSSPLRTAENRELSTNISNKRKRPIRRKNGSLEGSCIAKVEQLARVKQRQDEDKVAARLHSFDGSSGNNNCVSISSKKSEKMSSFKSISSSTKVRSSNAHELVPVIYPETILCIEVYRSRGTRLKTQELLVLGRQTLDEMRDKIRCSTDEVMEKAGQYDPSGYFLIEDIFCNDLREPSAIDYSKPILDWLRDSKKDALEKWEWIISGELQQKQKELLGSGSGPKLPQFKAVQMHKTRFCDLRFRLGAGYLYCHQGDCKHVIVIRDMRLIHPEDVQNQAAYPVVRFQSKVRMQKCSVCKIYVAEKMTVDDKWALENPCYFCGLCYYMLHYVNGSLLYNEFSVYDYLHD